MLAAKTKFPKVWTNILNKIILSEATNRKCSGQIYKKVFCAVHSSCSISVVKTPELSYYWIIILSTARRFNKTNRHTYPSSFLTKRRKRGICRTTIDGCFYDITLFNNNKKTVKQNVSVPKWRTMILPINIPPKITKCWTLNVEHWTQ